MASVRPSRRWEAGGSGGGAEGGRSLIGFLNASMED